MIQLKKLITKFILPLSITVLGGIAIYRHTNNRHFDQLMLQATYLYSTQDYKSAHLLYQQAHGLKPKVKIAIEGNRDCEIILGISNSDIFQLEWQSFHSFWVQLKLNFYYTAISNFHEGRAYVGYNGKYGFVDYQGYLVISPIYENVWHFSEGLAAVKENGKWSYINRQGKMVIFKRFDKAMGFRDGLAAVQINRKWGFINRKGDFLVSPKFFAVQSYGKRKAKVKVKRNEEWEIVTLE